MVTFLHQGAYLKICLGSKPISELFLKKHSPGFIMICGTIYLGGGGGEVRSPRGIETF